MNEKATGLELQEAVSPEALLPDHGLWPWWAAAGVLAVIIVTVLFLVLRKRKATGEDPRKLREDAFREALAALSGIHTEDPRDAAVRASLIVRKYLSVAAADPALYETHEEFVTRRNALEALTEAARASAETGFNRLSTLKYGPEVPDTPAADIIAESRALLETLHLGFTA